MYVCVSCVIRVASRGHSRGLPASLLMPLLVLCFDDHIKCNGVFRTIRISTDGFCSFLYDDEYRVEYNSPFPFVSDVGLRISSR